MTTPYDEYKETKLWKVVEEELNSLVENQDIEITTAYELIVGSLTKKIYDEMGFDK